MAGHSKWNNIKHKKAASDAKRGKIFTRHARMITIAAKQGGDIDMNPLLRAAIDAAKTDNVPNDNIERAIKKGTGELKDDTIIEELFYDSFGPGGVAIYIEVLTDNKNRSLTNIRNIINKKGGRFADSGSVAWMFKKRGLIIVECDQSKKDEYELIAIDSGAEEILFDDQMLLVYTLPEELMQTRESLIKNNLKVKSAEIVYEADNKVEISKESEDFEKLEKLIDFLDEDEDVSSVYTNAEIID